MAIVINGSGTVTGLSVGGLPDGTVDAGTVAADVATQAELDAKTDATKLPLTGGTMTGDLTVSGASTPKVTIKTNDGTSASLKLQRVNENDASTDFELKNDGGTLKILGDNSSQNEYETIRLTTTETRIYTSNTERVRIDSSGNVGIGQNPPTAPSSDFRTLEIKNTGSGGRALLSLTANSSEYSHIYFGDESDQDIGQIFYYHPDNSMQFRTNNTTFLNLRNDGTLISELAAGSSKTHLTFKNGGATKGSIVSSDYTNNTSYNTSSDYRLKENVDYTWDATTRLKQLKPARFNWIADDTNTLFDGFIAHEVQDIVPEAITGAKDAMTTDENGDEIIDPQGIDQSKLVPLLVKAMQEQQTTIEALTARITALES